MNIKAFLFAALLLAGVSAFAQEASEGVTGKGPTDSFISNSFKDNWFIGGKCDELFRRLSRSGGDVFRAAVTGAVEPECGRSAAHRPEKSPAVAAEKENDGV